MFLIVLIAWTSPLVSAVSICKIFEVLEHFVILIFRLDVQHTPRKWTTMTRDILSYPLGGTLKTEVVTHSTTRQATYPVVSDHDRITQESHDFNRWNQSKTVLKSKIS